MNKRIVILLLISSLFIFSGCAKDISEIKLEENVGKTVKVKGEVTNTIKLGSFSAFTISDGSDQIPVSSETLPKKGETVTIKGVLIKDSIFGFYIKSEE